jgi:glycosyltransferase involved in cell wall biosynthesis
MDSVAIVTRFVGQARVLDDVEGVQLHLVWLLDGSYRSDPDRRQWVDAIRREWKFSNFVVYALPLRRYGRIGQIISGIFRVLVLAGYIFRHKIGVVFLHCFDGVPGIVMKLRKLLGVGCVFDMQGAVPEQEEYVGMSARTVRRLEAREQEALQVSDSAFCVSQKLVEHSVRKYGVPEDNLHIVPCCVPRFLVGERLEQRQQMRRDLGLGDKFVVVYAGGTDRYQCIPDACALFAAIARKRDDAFWLVLSWGDHELFRRCLKEQGVDERRFRLVSVGQTAVHDHLIAADVGFLLREEHVLNRVASPTKFGEYLAAGVPVITTPYVGDVSSAVVRERIGTIVDLPLAVDQSGLMKFLDDVAQKREEFTRRCLEFVDREWTWEGHEEQFREAINAAGRRSSRREDSKMSAEPLPVRGERPVSR